MKRKNCKVEKKRHKKRHSKSQKRLKGLIITSVFFLVTFKGFTILINTSQNTG